MKVTFRTLLFSLSIGWSMPLFSLETKECSRAQSVYHALLTYHISPPEIHLLPRRIIESFVGLTDPDGLVLLQTDTFALNELEWLLLEDLKENKCEFIEQAISIYERRFLWVDSLLQSSYFDLSMDQRTDSILLVPWHRPPYYARDTQDFLDKWEKRIAYYTLLSYVESDTSDGKPLTSSFNQKRKHLSREILENERCRMQQMINENYSLENFLFSCYLKSITHSFDPHSDFYSEREVKQFESSLSSDIASSGLVISMSGFGKFQVVEVIPGGAAWETGEIESGDEVVGIATTSEKVHPACIGYSELQTILNSPEPEKVTITVKKKDNQIKEIVLKKKTIPNFENKLVSYILNGPHKIAYLSLPSFYTDWEKDSGNSAQDIATEILKFRNENVEGLILDLRFNGGGSMKEAIDLTGLFIDHGALMISRETGSDPIVYKDLHRGVIFEQNLIVLVNNFSASASEIVALALKDYNRALVVGEKTYGKASGQNILPVFTSHSQLPFGYVKVTTSRFFHVDGNSYQAVGIRPDIELSDPFPSGLVSEQSLKFPLSGDPVNKKVSIMAYKELPIEKLKSLSKARVDQDEVFQEIKALEDSLTIMYQKDIAMPLDPDRFFLTYQSMNTFRDSLYMDLDSVYFVDDSFNKSVITNNELEKINTRIKASVWSDPVIKETYKLMIDWGAINQLSK